MLPIGSILCFLLAQRFDAIVTQNIPRVLVVSELFTALAFYALYFTCSSIAPGKGASNQELLQFAMISLALGFFQSLSWTLLLSTTLRSIPNHFHVFRSFASAGWLTAGVALAILPNHIGILILAIGVICFAALAATAIKRPSITVPAKSHCSPKNNALLLVVAGILAAIECRYGINAQTYLSQSLGSLANLFLMVPVAIEIVLLLTVVSKARNCARTSRWRLLLGPLSWVVVTGCLALFTTIGSVVLLGLAFLACNVVFQAALCYRLPNDVKGQTALTSAQAFGALVGFAMTMGDAVLNVSLADSWYSTFMLAIGATAMVGAALLREIDTATSNKETGLGT